jgi:hypothetical protein
MTTNDNLRRVKIPIDIVRIRRRIRCRRILCIDIANAGAELERETARSLVPIGCDKTFVKCCRGAAREEGSRGISLRLAPQDGHRGAVHRTREVLALGVEGNAGCGCR